MPPARAGHQLDWLSTDMSNSLKTVHTPELDKEGYLVNLQDWSEVVADEMARQMDISLTEQHWEILRLMRDFHQRRGISPVMRILVKLVEKQLGPDKGNSLYLLKLFPESPARVASKIAGLPRPANCI